MYKTHLLSLLLISFGFTACSMTQTYQNRTGFFKSYDAFQPVAHSNSLFFYQEKDANLSAYDKMFIPEIQVLAHTAHTTPEDNRLYAQISAYATAAYTKNIIKNSANYTVVDVAQKGAMVMQIAISMVEVHPEDKNWDQLSALPFTLDAETYSVYSEGSARLLIEARISDAMSGKLLARSIRIVMGEEVKVHNNAYLQFKDLQAALDTWLYEAMLRH
jgi:hypothetical protein